MRPQRGTKPRVENVLLANKPQAFDFALHAFVFVTNADVQNGLVFDVGNKVAFARLDERINFTFRFLASSRRFKGS
jgi:hypothetical protein